MILVDHLWKRTIRNAIGDKDCARVEPSVETIVRRPPIESIRRNWFPLDDAVQPSFAVPSKRLDSIRCAIGFSENALCQLAHCIIKINGLIGGSDRKGNRFIGAKESAGM